MAYVGSEGSSYVSPRFIDTSAYRLHFPRSGFHRCFSSTVALNLLVESRGQYTP
jgi:hypothetical protein